MSTLPPTTCDSCSQAPPSGKTLLQCGRCKMAWYCGETCQRSDWTKHSFECSSLPAIIPAPTKLSTESRLKLRQQAWEVNRLCKDVLAAWEDMGCPTDTNEVFPVALLEGPELDALINYPFAPEFLFTSRRIPSTPSDLKSTRNRVRRLICALASLFLLDVVDTHCDSEIVKTRLGATLKSVWDRASINKIFGRPKELSEGEYHWVIEAFKKEAEGNMELDAWERLWVLKKRLVRPQGTVVEPTRPVRR